MNQILLFVVAIIYGFSDLGRKILLTKIGYGTHLFWSIPFLSFSLVSGVGFAIQMFVLSRYELTKTTIFLSVFATLATTTLGVVVLHERLNAWNYIGFLAALAAIVLLNIDGRKL